MGHNTKKSTILSILNRTKKSRATKLTEIIEYLGINEYSSFGTTKKLNNETIRLVIDARNKLFHSGSKFPEQLLWGDLFPIVTFIVDTILNRPDIIS